MSADFAQADREPFRALKVGGAKLSVVPFLAIFALAAAVPFIGNDYWVLIATRAAVYWVLVSGLTLVIGYAGQLAIGYVALLTLGAYVTSVLAAGNVLPPIPVFAALALAGLVGAVAGVIVGLPALRLRTFYFAMTTLGFATIVTQIALAWQSVTGGGIGLSGPEMPAPFNTTRGFFFFCLAAAAMCTWMSSNIAGSRYGRSLVAIRDADVAAEAVGISKPGLLTKVFIFCGALAAIAGGLFASLQTYITPDAFTFDLSLLFFISILIGGRGSILGPLIGTIVLTLLPEIAAPTKTHRSNRGGIGKSISTRTACGDGYFTIRRPTRKFGAACFANNSVLARQELRPLWPMPAGYFPSSPQRTEPPPATILTGQKFI